MDSKRDLSAKLISVAAMIVLGYVLFISVYNQIIVQSEGFFYIIVFGGILILAFILLSLVSKLLSITREIKDGIMWNFIEVFLFVDVAYLFLTYRLSYHSSVPAEETVIFRAAQLISEGSLGIKGMDMINQLLKFPSQYVYAHVLSVFGRLFGMESSTLITLNAIILIINAFIIGRIVRRMAGRTCGLLAAICSFFIPSQSFAVYAYSGEFFFCLVLMLSVYVTLVIIDTYFNNDTIKLFAHIGLGLLYGFLLFIEPLMLIGIIAFTVFYFFKIREKDENSITFVAIVAGVILVSFLIFSFSKSLVLDSGFGDVISNSMARFQVSKNIVTSEHFTFKEVFENFHDNLDNKNVNVRDNYYFLTNDEGNSYSQTQNAWFSLGTQMSYMFVLVMGIACAFYLFKNEKKKGYPAFILLFVSFVTLLFKSTNEESTYFFFEVLIILACCGLNYMYEFHHPEEEAEDEVYDYEISEVVENESEEEDEDAIARARALIFVGDDDEMYANIKQEEKAATDEEFMSSENGSDASDAKPLVEEHISDDASLPKLVVGDSVASTENKNIDNNEALEKPAEDAPVKKVKKVSIKDVDPADIITYVGDDGKVHKKVVRKVKKKVVKNVPTAVKEATSSKIETASRTAKASKTSAEGIKDVSGSNTSNAVGATSVNKDASGKPATKKVVKKKVVKKVASKTVDVATADTANTANTANTADSANTNGSANSANEGEKKVVKKKVVKKVVKKVPKNSNSSINKDDLSANNKEVEDMFFKKKEKAPEKKVEKEDSFSMFSDVELLEDPLPGPKKHVKRNLDFDRVQDDDGDFAIH